MSCEGAVRRRVLRWVLGALAALPAAIILAGCRSEPERVELPRPTMAPKRSKAYWESMLRSDAALWSSLRADCEVTVRSPQIPGALQTVRLTGGRLVIQKPNKVSLRVPASGKLRLLLVGDGQNYRVDMPVFNDRYTGTYDDAVGPQAGRIHIMPADLAYAFCPYNLLPGRAQTLTEWERISRLASLVFVEEPEPEVRTTSVIVLDRTTEVIMTLETYGPDGAVRSTIVFPRRAVLTTSEDRSVRVPAEVLIDYPEEQTRVLLRLENVKLNVTPEEGLFAVSP